MSLGVHPPLLTTFLSPLAPQQKSSPQSGRQQEGEEQQTSVPSFQEAFNDALLSASVAAHQGELALISSSLHVHPSK